VLASRAGLFATAKVPRHSRPAVLH